MQNTFFFRRGLFMYQDEADIHKHVKKEANIQPSWPKRIYHKEKNSIFLQDTAGNPERAE